MENYTEFMNRIQSFEKPYLRIEKRFFSPNPSIRDKVSETNAFQDFYGDTVVFDLSEETKEHLSRIMNDLYENVPECFCERLSKETLHMTLHDLSSSCNQVDIEEEMEYNQRMIQERMCQHPIAPQTIYMRSNYIINMVNTSLVLALYPVNVGEYYHLNSLYQRIESIRALPYPMTPHITLAYFNRYGFSKESIEHLSKTVWDWNHHVFDIQLNTEQLFYQRFRNMNHYENLFSLVSK